jgi:hypothetical protein
MQPVYILVNHDTATVELGDSEKCYNQGTFASTRSASGKRLALHYTLRLIAYRPTTPIFSPPRMLMLKPFNTLGNPFRYAIDTLSQEIAPCFPRIQVMVDRKVRNTRLASPWAVHWMGLPGLPLEALYLGQNIPQLIVNQQEGEICQKGKVEPLSTAFI